MSEEPHSAIPGAIRDEPLSSVLASSAPTGDDLLAALKARNDRLAGDNRRLQRQVQELEARNRELTSRLASREATVSAQDAQQHAEIRARARLETQTVELAEADRRKNQFLFMLGHELRNPLAPLRNALDLLALGSEEPTTRDWAYRVIERQTHHLERMVHDLLDVARISRGVIALQCQQQELGALVREALEAVDGAIRERGHRLEVALPTAPVLVQGDATRLVQVFTNLLQNAAKYTDDGGLIQVRLTVTGDHASVVIADNGRGIDEAIGPWLFDAFTQGPRPMAKAEGGLGLGLTLVKQLVTLHQGGVEAQSDGAAQGSRFTVRLPLDRSGPAVAAPAAADIEPAPADSPKLSLPKPDLPERILPRRILLVDDNTEVLDAMRMLLRGLGHDVVTATTGAEALRAVVACQPQVVLLDIGLPDIDGTEVARRLAELPARASFQLVALSGYAAQDDDIALFDAYLLKPAGRAALERVLQATDLSRGQAAATGHPPAP